MRTNAEIETLLTESMEFFRKASVRSDDEDAKDNALFAVARVPTLVKLVRELMQPKWIGINEKLPEKDGNYLCYHAEELVVISHFAGQSFWNDGEAQDILFWMPLPGVPQEDK